MIYRCPICNGEGWTVRGNRRMPLGAFWIPCVPCSGRGRLFVTWTNQTKGNQ